MIFPNSTFRALMLITMAVGAMPITTDVLAADAANYKDSQGRVIHLPMGDISFADKVIAFREGKPATSVDGYGDAKLALGPPDYKKGGKADAVALGCKGTLILQFTNNGLIDVKGADLHIFEVGKDVEATRLSISNNGRDWIKVGNISGGRASVDIDLFSKPDDVFRFVKLQDMGSRCGGNFPGADIDAVAAVGTGIRISLRSSVLFDFDKSVLKTAAEKELNRAAAKIARYPGARLIIAGHTDAKGSDSYNKKLSIARAVSVKQYLSHRLADQGYRFSVLGHGESQPIDSNKTEAGRERNRRVEIIIIPTRTVSRR